MHAFNYIGRLSRQQLVMFLHDQQVPCRLPLALHSIIPSLVGSLSQGSVYVSCNSSELKGWVLREESFLAFFLFVRPKINWSQRDSGCRNPVLKDRERQNGRTTKWWNDKMVERQTKRLLNLSHMRA